jgi:dipeptidyl aminopeptidase/acylaminoacyl peptidase
MAVGAVDRRRTVTRRVVAVGSLLMFGSTARGQTARQADSNATIFAPLVRVRSDEYAAARSTFHTSLVRRLPASDQWRAVEPPAGAISIVFPSNGLELKAWLQLPDSMRTTPHPTILWLHGGHSFDQGDWDATRPFRDEGYVVLAPMLRGENGQGGIYSLFYDEVDDVIAAAEYLRRQPFVDNERLYLAGHSVGGTMVMLTAEAYPHFAAAASISGSPDQAIFIRYALANRQSEIPFDPIDSIEIEMRSPLAFAESFKCPIRIFFGSEEPHFAISSRETAAVARSHGIDAEVSIAEGDHMTVIPAAIRRAIDFFRSVRPR